MNRHGGLTDKGKHTVNRQRLVTGKMTDDLPGWAVRCSEVVQLCKVNIGFRNSVMSATDPKFKRVLIQKARAVVREIGEGVSE